MHRSFLLFPKIRPVWILHYPKRQFLLLCRPTVLFSSYFWAMWHADISIHTTKSLVDDTCRVLLFHKKFNDSTLTKRYVSDSHFLAVLYGNVRGAHALSLLSCWRRKMPLMVLQCSLRYSLQILRNLTVLINFGYSLSSPYCHICLYYGNSTNIAFLSPFNKTFVKV